MSNNVKSFPPEWEEYDVNNFGKSGGGIDGVISFIDNQWVVTGKTFDDIMSKFENSEPSIFVLETVGSGSGASQSFTLSREVFRYTGDTENIYINFLTNPYSPQEYKFHWYADGHIELD